MTTGAKPKDGFLLGKFMPPHAGHKYLVDFARNYCEHLTILVATLPSEPIPGALRYKWMREMFPDCTVIWTDKELPQEPLDENDQDFWDIWQYEVYSAMNASHKRRPGVSYAKTYPDVIFASEEYGHKLAEVCYARFVPVDIERSVCPVSGTLIRGNPFMCWDYIPNVVRPYFQKRITMFGPESTGKSTLAKALKHNLGKRATYVPEYGRIYTEAFGADVDQTDISNIVHGHAASIAAAKLVGAQLIIEDTDPLMSMVWSDMLTGSHDPWFDSFNDYPDLYVLCDIDIPWIDDGTRYFKEDADRQRFMDLCERTLEYRGVNYIKVSGLSGNRFTSLVKGLEENLNFFVW